MKRHVLSADARRRLHRAKGWIDDEGEITPAGEEEAERRHAAEGAAADDYGPGPEPYPEGDLI